MPMRKYVDRWRHLHVQTYAYKLLFRVRRATKRMHVDNLDVDLHAPVQDALMYFARTTVCFCFPPWILFQQWTLVLQLLRACSAAPHNLRTVASRWIAHAASTDVWPACSPLLLHPKED
jgi:hypothetical protein